MLVKCVFMLCEVSFLISQVYVQSKGDCSLNVPVIEEFW